MHCTESLTVHFVIVFSTINPVKGFIQTPAFTFREGSHFNEKFRREHGIMGVYTSTKPMFGTDKTSRLILQIPNDILKQRFQHGHLRSLFCAMRFLHFLPVILIDRTTAMQQKHCSIIIAAFNC